MSKEIAITGRVQRKQKDLCSVLKSDFYTDIDEGQERKAIEKYGLRKENQEVGGQMTFLTITLCWWETRGSSKLRKRRYSCTCVDIKTFQIGFVVIQDRFRNYLKKVEIPAGTDIHFDHNVVLLLAVDDIKLKT